MNREEARGTIALLVGIDWDPENPDVMGLHRAMTDAFWGITTGDASVRAVRGSICTGICHSLVWCILHATTPGGAGRMGDGAAVETETALGFLEGILLDEEIGEVKKRGRYCRNMLAGLPDGKHLSHLTGPAHLSDLGLARDLMEMAVGATKGRAVEGGDAAHMADRLLESLDRLTAWKGGRE